MNLLIMKGNLTRDPQLKTVSDNSVVEFGIAVNKKWTDKSGNKKESTCFIDCNAWGRVGENIAKYFSKGREILAEGELVHQTWEKDGVKHSKHVFKINTFHFFQTEPKPNKDGKVPYEPPTTETPKELLESNIPF